MSDTRSENFSKVYGHIGFAILIVSALTAFYYFYLFFFPAPVTTFKRPTELEVDKIQIQAGDQIGVFLDYCKNQPLNSNITVGFVDSYLSPSQQVIRNLPIGCHKAKLNFTIPSNLPDDDYALLLEVRYDNATPFRPEVHELMSQHFHVTNPSVVK